MRLASLSPTRSFPLVSPLASIALLAALGFGGCDCGAPVDPPDVVPAVGTINVAVDGATATLSVSGLQRSLRSLQVDVDVKGGRASAIAAAAGHNLIEGGLLPADGGPRDRFTAVVADTRRLPINNGAVARITVDAGATVGLKAAVAIDDTGARRILTVGSN